MIRIELREDGCRGCRMCVDICPTDVLTFDEAAGKARVSIPEDCIGCLSCAYLCPSGTLQHYDHHVVRNFYREIDFSRRTERFL